ncbi:MAG TPA: GIY-YIG nuclease family protein [Edaphobacter sp.]
MPNRENTFYVYILASRSRNLYIGVTNNLIARILQHRELRTGTYTEKYKITRLVHFERFAYILNAIAREKELKDWNRQKKLHLIEQDNPSWEDLAAAWLPAEEKAKADSSAALRNDKFKMEE